MVDIHSANSSAATGTSSPPTTQASTPALTALQVVVVDISQALQNLTRTIQTGATPIALPNNNSLTLATALGNITITLPQLAVAEQQALLSQLIGFIQTQRSLTLSLQPGSPPTQAVLLIPSATNTSTVFQSPPVISQSQALPVLSLAKGEILPAIVLPLADPTVVPTASEIPLASTAFQQTTALPQSLPTATTTPSLPIPPLPSTQGPSPAAQQSVVNNAQIIAETDLAALPLTPSSPPPAQGVPLAQNPISSGNQPFVSLAASAANPALITPQGTPAPPSQSSQVVSPLPNLLQPGNEVTLRIESVLPSAPTTTPPLAPNQILATVSGTGTDGQLILKAGTTTLFVKAQVSAPVGTTVIVSVDPAKAQPLVTLPQSNPVNFPALPQALAALAQIDPQALQQIMVSRLPQPTAMLPGALLFLFSAFKSGNVRGWLGDDATDKLSQTGKLSLIASLSRELSAAGEPTQDATVGQWRAYPIPLYTQQQFQALTLYVHGDHQQNSDAQTGAAGQKNKIRFLIDMRLSKLGAMQIDGFVQPKKLDMILRSETLLPEGLHNELRLSYIKALGAVGYTGALNFQVGRQYWMRMQTPELQGIVT
jgi:hypothetical protein